MAVKFLVNGRALQPEIGAQINDSCSRVEKWPGEFRGHAVGQGKKNHVGRLREQFDVRFDETKVFDLDGWRIWGTLAPASARHIGAR